MKNGLLSRQKKSVDKQLLLIVFLLVSLGLLAMADASAPQALNIFSDKFYFFKQQALWGVVGIAGLLIVSNIHYSFWNKIAVPLFSLTVILLILVLIPGVGTSVLGARRWLVIAGNSIQPSEIAKLSLAIYLAKVAQKDKNQIAYFLPLILVAGLIMLEPDLGTTLIITVIGMAQIFISGINFYYFLGAGAIGSVASLMLILFSDYRRRRLLTFLARSQDPLGSDYHIRQVLLGLGSGGFLGVGLGQSRQKYLFLPEAATDSIFAVVAEEIGFLGSAVLIVLFAYFIYRCFKVAINAPDKFSKVLAIGITSWIAGQIILNIGSMVALVPLTGIPLPFFSYGGSALTMLLVSMGIILNISKHAKQ